MNLLIDYGNTRVKWASWDGVALGAVAAASNTEMDLSTLWKDHGSIDAAWIASVASAAANASLAAALRGRFGIGPVFAATRAQACGVRIAYAEPVQLGVDRFLCLIAAHAMAATGTVIVSCGTALTMDALAADGTHLGGLIAASPDMAAHALRVSAARLADVPAGNITDMADNSADAIASGTWLSAVALIERFHARTERRLGACPMLILAGGGAMRLSGLLGVPHRIEADLVLRGLAHYAQSSR